MTIVDFVSIEPLLENILNESIDHLSEDDVQMIECHKEFVVDFLLPIIREQLSFFSEDPSQVNGNNLYWGLALLSFLKEAETFEILRMLCYLDPEIVDEHLGLGFITECLSFMLAATCSGRWKDLKEEIENQDLDEYARGACLDALTILIIEEEVAREEVISYYKECFQRILYKDLKEDEPLATQLVNACMDIWPGECLEEIKELYGLDCIDKNFIEINDLLDCFALGKEACIHLSRLHMQEFHPLYPLIEKATGLSKKIEARTLENLSKDIDDAYFTAKNILSNKNSRKKNLLNELLKEKRICFESTVCDDIKSLPIEEQEKIALLQEKFLSAPLEALQETLIRIQKFPENPIVYFHLYIIYNELNWKREAVELMKTMLFKFPRNLISMVEYAKYLLRRGEANKVKDLFKGCKTLQEIYPERTTFSWFEWQLFSYVMALYDIELEDYAGAKSYLEILEKIDPDSKEVLEVEEKLKMNAFSKAFQRS